MIAVITQIVKNLIEDESSVKFYVEETSIDDNAIGVIVTAYADAKNIDKIKGKNDAVETAIRTILKNCQCEDGKRYFFILGDATKISSKEKLYEDNVSHKKDVVELVKAIVKSLVIKKDEVEFNVEEEKFKKGTAGATIAIIPSAIDMGKVIGRNGAVVSAIRNIVKNCYSNKDKNYNIKIDVLQKLRSEDCLNSESTKS